MSPNSISREQLVREAFESAGIDVFGLDVKSYPDETNIIVYVSEADVPQAARIGNEVDDGLASASDRTYVVVRKAPSSLVSESPQRAVSGVQDARASDLIRLISARSRVSLVQPSLSYVRDAQANLDAVTAARHQLVFGRRGAGKTALLVEAREQLRAEQAITAWVNIQTLRKETPGRVVLYVLEEVLARLQSDRRVVRTESLVSLDVVTLYEHVRSLLGDRTSDMDEVYSLVPKVQQTLHRFLEIEGVPLFVFMDDFYYLPRDQQPVVLDALHGCVRDCNAWLKVASIRHLTRWFQSAPPVGLQTGHDADLIDLDVTLQEPGRAQEFLESVLSAYARAVGIGSLTRIFSSKALDRLVIASGAVPRDYLVLASSALAKARTRQNASLVGAQDVNQAAGDAASAKVQELEEDMASNVGTAEQTLAALKVLRGFCIEETSFVYFLVSFRDKEDCPREYSLLTELLDVRLIHMLDSGVSDPHAAGHRLEAFMLDLSQYSGSRLKQRINVLDFSKGRMIARETRTNERTRAGDTPLRVIAILRAAPTFELDRLSDVVALEPAAGN